MIRIHTETVLIHAEVSHLVPVAAIVAIVAVILLLPFIIPSLRLEAVKLVLGLRNNDADGWAYYGELLLNAGQMSSAQYALKRAVTLNPNMSRAWIMLGDVYSMLQLHAEAEEAYRQAVKS
jgi:cytochrome c-type biogenesis protein CcmH/NrfG